jgi:uncharacterized protein (DUF1778 family)
MPSHQKRPKADHLGEIIQFRISTKDKEDLMKAAAASGFKYTTYARQHLLYDVHKDLKALNENKFILDNDTWDRFLEILEAPAEVPPKLKSAQAKFKKKYSK